MPNLGVAADLFPSKVVSFDCHLDHNPKLAEWITVAEEYEKLAERLLHLIPRLVEEFLAEPNLEMISLEKQKRDCIFEIVLLVNGYLVRWMKGVWEFEILQIWGHFRHHHHSDFQHHYGWSAIFQYSMVAGSETSPHSHRHDLQGALA